MKKFLSLCLAMSCLSVFAQDSGPEKSKFRLRTNGAKCVQEYTDGSRLELKIDGGGKYSLSWLNTSRTKSSFYQTGNLNLSIKGITESGNGSLTFVHNKSGWNGDRGGDVSFGFTSLDTDILERSEEAYNNGERYEFVGSVRFLNYRGDLGSGTLIPCVAR